MKKMRSTSDSIICILLAVGVVLFVIGIVIILQKIEQTDFTTDILVDGVLYENVYYKVNHDVVRIRVPETNDIFYIRYKNLEVVKEGDFE